MQTNSGNHHARRSLSLHITAILALGVLLSACDTLGPEEETVTLSTQLTFDFRPTSEQLQSGSAIAATSTVDLTSVLRNQYGYNISDVVAARVSSVRLDRVQPVGVNLDNIFAQVGISISGGGMTAVVGQSGSLPSRDTASLSTTNTDISNAIRNPPASIFLNPEPAGNLTEPNYIFRAVVDFAVTVEGI